MVTWTLTEEDAAEVLTLIRWASLAGRSKFSEQRAKELYQELSAAEDLPSAENEKLLWIAEALQGNAIHEIVNRLLHDDVNRRDLADYLYGISREANLVLKEINE